MSDDNKLRTSIKSIPVDNEKLYHEVAKLNKISPSHTREIIEFMGHYITNTIKEGKMEAVMLPGFGKFKPKLKHLKALHKLQLNKPTGREDIFRIITTGKPLKNSKISGDDTL